MTRITAGRGHKYGAKPTVVDGIRFASQKEARRYQELKLLVKAGEIGGLLLQPSYDLYVDDLSIGGRLRRASARLSGKHDCREHRKKIGTYRADFSYWEPPISDPTTTKHAHVVEDVKGFKTPLYRWKKKHVEAQYGIQIREV